MRSVKLTTTLLFFIFVSTISLLASNNEYNITGIADARLNGKKVMLLKFKDEKVSHADTSIVKEGVFRFQGHVDTPTLAYICYGNYPDTILTARLMVEPGQIKLTLNKKTHIGGTRLNDIYQSFLDKDVVYKDSIKLVIDQLKGDSTKSKRLHVVLFNLRDRKNQTQNEFWVANSSNALGVILFKEQLSSVTAEQFLDIYSRSDSMLRNEPYIKWCTKEFEQEAIITKKRIETQNTIIGKPYPDFISLTSNGKEVKISDMINDKKYTLIVFWASWCSPCMAEQPIIKEIYDKYKEKGLDVIGVSLDADDAAWKRGIVKINSKWSQLRNEYKNDKVLRNAYGFEGIPYNTLIGKDGKVLESNIGHSALKRYLDTLLNSN